MSVPCEDCKVECKPGLQEWAARCDACSSKRATKIFRCNCGVLCLCPGMWDYVGSLAGMTPEQTEAWLAPLRKASAAVRESATKRAG